MNHHQDVHPILPTAESQRSTRPSALSKSTSSMVDASKALDDPIKKRPFMTKFATIHTDRYPQNLRRDFPLNQFEGNLTVEKAHFEPQPLTNPTKEPMVAPVQALPSQPYPFSASQQPTQPSQFHDSDLSHTLSTTGHRGAGSPPSHEYHPSSSPPRHAYTAPPSIVGITPPPPPPPSHTPSSGAVPKTRNSVKPKNEVIRLFPLRNATNKPLESFIFIHSFNV
ncbi:uncharacterized protein BYT42DRAFT_45329 [Radiomyces spectabilis]|uniref:uncharacterized protein n=1 Tax=Radiomyces spectabilis TaxID=64574 RepID=UPI00221EF134|nr:uncharacterized protein BYT42DRAFT_45329 [Radiomyces spectabilis]KAI8372770.1 hypothetical protein BYT42DRAFT_45329 [Radiomyces spectabilis]